MKKEFSPRAASAAPQAWWSPLRRSSATALALALLLSGCSCGEGPGTQGQAPRLTLALEADPSGRADHLIDFGAVALGTRATRSIELGNGGATTLVLQVASPAEPFGIGGDPKRIEIAVGGKRTLAFSFSPFDELGAPSETIVELATNEGGGRTRSIRLVGVGVKGALACDPPSLDFGLVMRGEERTLDLRCTNQLDASLELVLGGFRGNHASLFSLSTRGAFEERRQVLPGEAVELEVHFQATAVGRNDATLVLLDDNEETLALVPLQAETMASALELESSACLDFGYVGLGESKEGALRLRNRGTEAIEIVRVVVANEDAGIFSAASPLPLVVPPGVDGAAELMLTFEPDEVGVRTAQIGLVHTDGKGGTETLTACASGFGGGPTLLCSGGSIDFGTVALEAPVTRRLSCRNEERTPSGVAVDPLRILGIRSDHESFSAAIRELDGGLGPKEDGYRGGEGFAVEVVFSPTEEVFSYGEIVLETSLSKETRLVVSGTGRDLPPCEFSVIPAQLRFGVVNREQEKVRSFAVVNHQETACLISDLHLADGSDPAFSLEPIESIELGPLQTLEIPVRFAPPAYEPLFLGTVRFQISNRERQVQEVELRGSSQRPCLVMDPDPIDLGSAQPGCFTRPRSLMLSNACEQAARITRVEVSDTLDAGAFQLRRYPPLPRELLSNRSEELLMSFGPDRLGAMEGALFVWIEGQEEPYVYLLHGEGSEAIEQTDTFHQAGRAKVDILWVIDNSGSMSPYQDRLRENLSAFLSYTEQQNVDFQIGVTSTGLTPMSSTCPGGADGGEDGRLFPINGERPRILRPNMPQMEEHWKENVLVGLCHGAEFAFEAGLRAVTPPLIDNYQDPRYRTGFDDGNAGFLRHDAALSVIFVSDEPEQSSWIFGITPHQYVERFKEVKGPRSGSNLRLHAISEPANGSGAAFLEVVEATGGTWIDIRIPTSDNDQWEAALRRMSEGALGYSSRFYLRGQPGNRNGTGPVSERDIEVRVNGIPRAPTFADSQVWRYDPMANAVDFTPLFVPKPDAEITVTYLNACLDE